MIQSGRPMLCHGSSLCGGKGEQVSRDPDGESAVEAVRREVLRLTTRGRLAGFPEVTG
ncbi:hypothetical protein GCM10027612_62240 [Microbispora bryophytorum subsp. camponoti]